nr:MAG TPA: hypothetical protein [Caudoviricetes sp.]
MVSAGFNSRQCLLYQLKSWYNNKKNGGQKT